MAVSQITQELPVMQLLLPLFAEQVDPPLRDNRNTMGYPFLSLEKDRKDPIEYRDKDFFAIISSDSRHHIATIWDWDFIIIICSQINDAHSLGKPTSSRVSFRPHQILKQMGRGVGGQNYKELAAAIERLYFTNVVSNLDPRFRQPFRWIDHYKLALDAAADDFITPENPDGKLDPNRPWEITLPNWLYEGIINKKDILSVHPDYLNLTGGIERFLYRIGRRALGHNDSWLFKLETLYKLSGIKSPFKYFTFRTRKIANENKLPELQLTVENDMVVFRYDPKKLTSGQSKKRAKKTPKKA